MIGGRLIIRNRSHYPDDEVERLIKFSTAELDVRGEGLLVVVDDLRGGSSCGRWTVYDTRRHSLDRSIESVWTPGSRYVVWVRLGPKWTYPAGPFVYRDGRDEYETWQQGLVSFVAWSAKWTQDTHDGMPTKKSRCRVFARSVLERYRASTPRKPAVCQPRARPSALAG